jgi:hypothetical protein
MNQEKFNELLKVSDPEEVDRRAIEYYGRPTYLSTRKYKKYMIHDDWGKWHHFGDIRYQDGTYHKNMERIIRYKKRMMGVKGNWRNDKYSPNWLSLRLLW